MMKMQTIKYFLLGIFILCMTTVVSGVYAEESKSSSTVKKMPVEFEEEQASSSGPALQEEEWGPSAGGYDPFEEFRLLSQRVRQMMDPWMQDARMGRMSRGMGPLGMGTSIRADFEETFDEYIVTLDLPGYDKADIEVSLKNNVLHVQAQAKSEESREAEKEGRKMISRERHQGMVKRVIRFPQPVKEEEINAKFANGVLTIRVPKAEPEKSVKVEVL